MKISACIIAKNEEALLPQCLASIASWVDEIVLVDTGSTDRTMEIAKEYGAKIYQHPWQNDFSLHRNQSIEYATGDWILIIDCDEQIVSDMRHFKKRLDRVNPDIGGLVVKIHEISDGQRSTSWLGIRFFRKSSGIHYKGLVHNKASYSGGCAATDIVMHHYGYSLAPDKMAQKRQRTESLLLYRLEQNETDHAALYYMCQLKIGEKDYHEAEKYGLRFFHCVPVGPNDFQFYSVMYFYMAWSYLHLEDGNRAYSWAKKGLEVWPDDLDLNYIMARIGYQSERKEWLEDHSRRYFKALGQIRSAEVAQVKQFESAVDVSMFNNRTVYTADPAAENSIKTFCEMEAITI